MRQTRKNIWRWIPAAALMVAALVLMGCARTEAPDSGGLPKYAYRSAQVLRGYRLAVANQELLARLPCYCGCGQDPSYINLRDCFISEDKVFTSHGANCLVCLEQVEDAVAWREQGLATREVRERTDAKYRDRGVPTDTPAVEE